MSTDTAERSPAETADATTLFKHSRFLHVGDGAAECGKRENGECCNPDHFHAWLRKPNTFQHREIMEHALAAKARRKRQFEDPESSAAQILAENMEVLAGSEPESLVEELLADKREDVVSGARQDVMEDEKFELIDKDLERLDHLIATKDDSDERRELEKHVAAFEDAVNDRIREIQEPEREALLRLPKDDLVGKVRDLRIEQDSFQAYGTEYQTWKWFLGTLKPVKEGRPSERVFGSIHELRDADEQVIEALAVAFLEMDMGALGNG